MAHALQKSYFQQNDQMKHVKCQMENDSVAKPFHI
jgi:hypothetical protein